MSLLLHAVFGLYWIFYQGFHIAFLLFFFLFKSVSKEFINMFGMEQLKGVVSYLGTKNLFVSCLI